MTVRVPLSDYERKSGLSLREANFLKILLDEGTTIAKGTTVGADLAKRGFIQATKSGRYAITVKGRTAVSGLMPRTK
jgi:predicted transcriptional regulator